YDLRRQLFGSARGPITPDQVLEVARKSGATVLLSGQHVGDANDQYVTWQLVDTRNGASLGARRVDGTAMTSLADGVIAGVVPLLARQCNTESSEVPTPVAKITTESEDAYAHYVSGMDALPKMQIEHARGELEAAVALDSTFALGWFGLAKVYGGEKTGGSLQRGKPGCEAGDRAWALRSRLGIKDRMLLEAWLARECRNDIQGAIDTHREIVARWPDDRGTITELVDMLRWIHMSGEAVPIAEEGLRRYPEDRRLAEALAGALAGAGQLERAIGLVRELAKAEPDNGKHWDNIGGWYLGLGMPDSAEAAFERSVAVDPSLLLWSKLSKAQCEYFRGDVEGAIDELRRLEQTEISDEFRRRIGNNVWRMLAELGRRDAAFEKFRSVTGAHVPPGTPNYVLLLPDGGRSQLISQLASERERLADARTPIEIFRAHWAIVGTASLLDSVGVARPSVAAAEDLINEVFPANSWWHNTLGMFAFADDRPADALRHLHDADRMAVYPPYWAYRESRRFIARAHRALGDYENAARVLNDLWRLSPGHFLAQYELGLVYEDMNKPGEAASAYTIFLDAWSEADADVPQLIDAQQRLAAIQSGR
ncbi:MAG: tetratricopeptide repeat protein, partial [Candidatus Krumholzibacteriota bacterium]|nr:tetratricopeptide repeat protein [Candidatus Krumholzibacteriota bacterium]